MNISKRERELLAELEQLQGEVATLKRQKRYGLVWEDKPETFDKQSQKALPVLKEKGGKFKDVTNDNSGEYNVLIEGDNYHALSVLGYTHRGKIDIVYIDPPYNTGNKSWRYNNHYVEKDDCFKHSKWLSFMAKRLRIAKDLLSKDGVLICAIDENEHAPLGMLLQELFPQYEITCVTIIHNPGGIQGNNFSYTHEYAYFVFPKGDTRITTVAREDVKPTPLRDWGGDGSKRNTAKNCFYPILVEDGKVIGFGDVCEDDFHPQGAVVEKDGRLEIYPVDNDGVERKWRFARDSVEKIHSELQCDIVNGEPTIRRYKRDYRWKTVWTDKKYNANVFGTQLLAQILQGDFPYPKSLYTVIDCLSAVIHDKNNATVLDFFVGSGTTAQAVMEMNKQDGGNRKFIISTNNENGICEEVTYERVKRVMNGYTSTKGDKVAGLGGNLKYLKTDFVPFDQVTDNLKHKFVDRSTEILCLKEGTFDLVKNGDKYDTNASMLFENKQQYTAILYDLFHFDEFVEQLKSLTDKPVAVYVFSYTKDFPREEFGDLAIDFRVEAIPEKVLETYKRIFAL